MKHKWYDVIVAWAAGKEIQCRAVNDTTWRYVNSPNWDVNNFEFRVKPETNITLESRYYGYYENTMTIKFNTDEMPYKEDMTIYYKRIQL